MRIDGQSCLEVTAVALAAAFLAFSPACAAPIHDAARDGAVQTVKNLLAEDPSLIDARDENGCTPLILACRGEQADIVKYLIAKGAEVNAADKNSTTALHVAAASGQSDIVQRLIDAGAGLDPPDYERQTPLHYAATEGHDRVARILVKKGADLEARNVYERTPLLLVARESGSAPIARALLDAGADVNAQDRWGGTPLELAAWRGFGDVIDLLMDHGADVPAVGEKAPWILRFATERGLERLFNYMAEHGADLTISGEGGGSLLHSAAASPSPTIVSALLAGGMDVNEPDSYGWSPLHRAAEMGRAGNVEALVAGGADMDARTLDGKTALNLAQEFGRREAAEKLVALGADESPADFPVLEGPYLGQDPPGSTPELFALGVVSGRHTSHSSIAFSPDGTEAYWTPSFSRPEGGYGYSNIYYSRVVDGRWTLPEVAPFARGDDTDVPIFSPDGDRLYFVSVRPVEPGGDKKERIWFVEREGGAWSEPEPLDTPANDMDIHWQFSLDRDGNLYFGASSGASFGAGDVFVSRLVGGRYLEPENLGEAVNAEGPEFSPFIAPDGSYLLFSRAGRAGEGIFVSFRKADGSWSEAKSLWPEGQEWGGICPILSPDGSYLFYLGGWGGVEGICWLDAGIINERRGEAAE
jgi:ankyrin repeat protein